MYGTTKNLLGERGTLNKHELLKLILEDAKIEKLTLDMQHEDLKKMIQIKKREFKALHQNIEKH